MAAWHGHVEGRVAVEEAGRLEHERRPARVDGRLHLGTDAELRAATCVAAELLRVEGQFETLAAGAHADVIVLDGDPLEDIGLLADPAAHIALVIQALPSCGSAGTWSRTASALSSDIRVIISANQTEKLAKITRISSDIRVPLLRWPVTGATGRR